jgi:hypothetical protein
MNKNKTYWTNPANTEQENEIMQIIDMAFKSEVKSEKVQRD